VLIQTQHAGQERKPINFTPLVGPPHLNVGWENVVLLGNYISQAFSETHMLLLNVLHKIRVV